METALASGKTGSRIQCYHHPACDCRINALHRRLLRNIAAPSTQLNSVEVSHLFDIHHTHAELPVPSSLNNTFPSDGNIGCAIVIGMGRYWTYATRDSIHAYPTIQTRDARTDLANLSRKGIGKLLLGILASVSSTLLARASWDAEAGLELTGCLLHVVIIPSTFRIPSKREHVPVFLRAYR